MSCCMQGAKISKCGDPALKLPSRTTHPYILTAFPKETYTSDTSVGEKDMALLRPCPEELGLLVVPRKASCCQEFLTTFAACFPFSL